MDKLIKALKLRRQYNEMKFSEFVTELEKHLEQKIPEDAIKEYEYTGLNNVDFITTGWLTQCGIKEIM